MAHFTWEYALELEKLRSARGNRCEGRPGAPKPCGRRLRRGRDGRVNLEFAHVRPTGVSGMGRGLRQRVLDIRRFPSAYLLLCKLCHRAFDREREAAA